MEQAVTGYVTHNDTGLSVNETRVDEIENNVKLTNSERLANRKILKPVIFLSFFFSFLSFSSNHRTYYWLANRFWEGLWCSIINQFLKCTQRFLQALEL